jgi:hypothetical protein
MKTTKKRIPINFRKELYDSRVNDFNNRIALQKLITNEIKKLTGADPIEIEFSEAIKSFYKILEVQKAEVNTLGLTGEKLSELLSIDLSNLNELQREYLKVRFAEVPSIEAFTTYADTPEEIEKYEACQILIKAIEVAKIHLDKIGNFNQYKIKKALLPMLDYNDELQRFEQNNVFIKN